MLYIERHAGMILVGIAAPRGDFWRERTNQIGLYVAYILSPRSRIMDFNLPAEAGANSSTMTGKDKRLSWPD